MAYEKKRSTSFLDALYRGREEATLVVLSDMIEWSNQGVRLVKELASKVKDAYGFSVGEVNLLANAFMNKTDEWHIEDVSTTVALASPIIAKYTKVTEVDVPLILQTYRQLMAEYKDN